MKHSGADAMKRLRAEKDPRAEQLAAIFSCPVICSGVTEARQKPL